jgi:hypothetical protein
MRSLDMIVDGKLRPLYIFFAAHWRNMPVISNKNKKNTKVG